MGLRLQRLRRWFVSTGLALACRPPSPPPAAQGRLQHKGAIRSRGSGRSYRHRRDTGGFWFEDGEGGPPCRHNPNLASGLWAAHKHRWDWAYRGVGRRHHRSTRVRRQHSHSHSHSSGFSSNRSGHLASLGIIDLPPHHPEKRKKSKMESVVFCIVHFQQT